MQACLRDFIFSFLLLGVVQDIFLPANSDISWPFLPRPVLSLEMLTNRPYWEKKYAGKTGAEEMPFWEQGIYYKFLLFGVDHFLPRKYPVSRGQDDIVFYRRARTARQRELTEMTSSRITLQEPTLRSILDAESQLKYSYVILDDTLTLTALDEDAPRDAQLMGKHCVLANYAAVVRYAGEIKLFTNGTLHVDNNSGTYSPNGSSLDRVQALFEKNFPDDVFVVLQEEDRRPDYWPPLHFDHPDKPVKMQQMYFPQAL